MKKLTREPNFWKKVAIAFTFCLVFGIGTVFVEKFVTAALLERYPQSTIDLINGVLYVLICVPAIFLASKYIESLDKTDS